MKNRVLSVLLCLAIMATTVLSALTSLAPVFSPMEVEAAVPCSEFTDNGYPGRLAIYPARYMNTRHTQTYQQSWWDKNNTMHTEHAFDSTVEFSDKQNCLKIKGEDGSNAASYGRVRINLNDITGGIAAAQFTHVRLIFRVSSKPSYLRLRLLGSSTSMSSSKNVLNSIPSALDQIQALDMEVSGVTGNIDCLWIDLVGTIYLYAVQLYDSGLSETIRNKYLQDEVRHNHGKVTATFNQNGGTGTLAFTTKDCGWGYNGYNYQFDSPGSLTKTGYQFAGWNGNTGKLTVSNFVINATNTVEFKAQWTANTYIVRYNANGGSGEMSDVTHTYNKSKNLTANKFTKGGYTFKDWNTKADGSGNSYDDGQSVENLTTTNGATVNLYARWEKNTYIVRYNANGGSGAMNDVIHTYDDEKNLTASTFTKDGYTFTGWNTKADGSGNSYTNSESVKNLTTEASGTVNLYAQWTANSNTITYNTGTGATSVDSTTYTTGKKVTISSTVPTRPGYTFEGWKVSTAGTNWTADAIYSEGAIVESENEMYGNVVLTAQWEANTYTVTYDGNGNTGGTTDTSTHIYDKEKALTTGGFTKNGYTFTGWNTKVDGTGIGYTDGQSVVNLAESGNVTLYAQWSADSNTITYNSDGGSAVNAGSYNTGTSATLAAAPTKPGYTFAGWKVTTAGTNWTSDAVYEESATVTSTNEMYGPVTLTAQWTINDYTLTFDGNGVGSPDDMGYQVISDGALPTLAREGYTFNGWKPTESDGSWDANETYDGDTPLEGKYGSVELVAQWTANTYTVTYNANGATGGSTDSSTHTYDTNKTLTDNGFTKTGHTFVGWNTAADGTGDSYANLADVKNLTAEMDGSVILYAQWTANGYDITYNVEGGKLPDGYVTSYIYGTKPTLPTPIRAGFQFRGWQVTGLGQDAEGWTLNETYTAVPAGALGEVELTAQWLWIGISINYQIDNAVGTLTSYGDQMNNVNNMVVTTEGSAVKTLKEGYVFGGWYIDAAYTTPVDPDWVDEYGRLKVDLREVPSSQWLTNYTFYAKGDYETQTITLSAQCTENPAQTFIYKITGTPVLAGVLGEISLEVTLLSGESMELKMPVGDYVITEYTDWSWRYPNTADADQTEDVERDVAIISRYDASTVSLTYGIPTNILWLNSYSVSVTSNPGKEPETTS